MGAPAEDGTSTVLGTNSSWLHCKTVLILLQVFCSYLELVMGFACRGEWKKVVSIINTKD